jgi:hypothetical protein
MSRPALALLALGATLGVALDAWHVLTATTWYAHPWLFGIATWTIPLFAFAGLAVGALPVALERALGTVARPAPPPRVAAAVALFVLAYLVTGVVRGAACAVVLTLLAAAIYAVGDRPPLRLALTHALAAGLGGALTEMTLVHYGAFFHTDDRFFGVAPWLPLLYVCASLALTTLARALVSPSRVAASSAG